ncbi:MAG TPA: hypothetical protein DIV86_01750 [Alphaproteobacteria bacterium]|nr:hypothetical protein [Alphaproteobacteria bacterium]
MFLGKKNRYLKKLFEFISELKKSHANEYQRFKEDLIKNYSYDIMNKHISNLNEYVQGYDQFNQLLLYVTKDKAISQKMHASSKDFNLVKMFYGNLFEYVSANYIIPACLNNIYNNRPYDIFESMDLKKYLTLKKANRANPFINNLVFKELHECIDSTIRNSSHHGAIRLTNDTNIIEYRSGDEGNWKAMKYSDYLYKCNEIMIVSMYMLAMHIFILES